MPSFFVDRRPQADGQHLVHQRALCPPGCFPNDAHPEYLGELLDAPQALTLARLKYRCVDGCSWCAARVREPLMA